QQQRVSLTNQLIDLHIKLGIQKPVTLQALQAVGGDLEVFQFRQSAQKQNFTHFKKTVNTIMPNNNDIIRLQSAIAKQDYAQVLQFIQQYPKADRHKLTWDMNQSLLGVIIVANPQIPFTTIQQFIDAGIQPFLADLAAFTTLDLPLPLIDMVQQHFKGELNQQWQDNFRSYNLTLLAAENSSAVLFDYWRSLGIPASLQPQAPNAFDLIPLPTSEQQLERQISKIRTLLTAGILPRAADVRRQWLLLLPEQESQQLSELLQQQPELLVEKEGQDTTQLEALQQVQTEFNQLLQQVATCPKAQQWPIGIATVRDLPERYYLKFLKSQQESSQRMKDLTSQDLASARQNAELVQKKDWQGLKDLMLQKQDIPAEEVDVTVMMFMMMFNASSEDLQQYLSNFKQLSSEHLKRLSEVASPEHRELFKATGFELPFNAEAAKRHQQLLELQQRMKKSEQRRAETKQ
ncbi:MAG: hypothetical protein KKF79_15860, partial [Gammaproteobacteria bacterium]|nr:hypothetical protein [Gammaproteobacteria bacterium]